MFFTKGQEVYRLCEKCFKRLVYLSRCDDTYYFKCPDCGKVYFFFENLKDVCI
jgi:predicted  nucleic acid-binding Zn ribbon protein